MHHLHNRFLCLPETFWKLRVSQTEGAWRKYTTASSHCRDQAPGEEAGKHSQPGTLLLLSQPAGHPHSRLNDLQKSCTVIKSVTLCDITQWKAVVKQFVCLCPLHEGIWQEALPKHKQMNSSQPFYSLLCFSRPPQCESQPPSAVPTTQYSSTTIGGHQGDAWVSVLLSPQLCSFGPWRRQPMSAPCLWGM